MVRVGWVIGSAPPATVREKATRSAIAAMGRETLVSFLPLL
jgi:hypothetical protein